MSDTLTVYIDYKSPYAYLALQPTRDLAAEFGLKLNWMPYSLRIEDYLGAVASRNAHQWRRVKYSYMDARRLANDRGMVIRGPQKLFNSSIAHMGMLFAKSCRDGVVERYHDIVFEGFFKRELDIEVLDHVLDALAKAGASPNDFQEFQTGPGPALLDTTLKEAEDRLGIFGVPTFVIADEIFWGGERLALVRNRLEQNA
jgi:2-hydroxychromene-2-carboxylate isomerase